MKYTLTLLVLLACICSYGQQNDTTKYVINQGYGYQYHRWKVDDIQIIPHAGRDTSSKDPGQLRIIDTTGYFSGIDGKWRPFGTGGSGSIDLSGFVLVQTLAPTAAITGGVQQELLNPTSEPQVFNLSWTAGRQAAGINSKATAPIATILVNGIPQAFTPVAIGSSVSGTTAVTIPANVNTTVSIVVTTTDGKSTTASTTFGFYARAYHGWSTSGTPTDAELLAMTGAASSSRATSWIEAPPSGPQHLVYAYPEIFGDLTILKINDFTSLAAFTKTVRPFTNSSGYTQNYTIYVSTNLFTVTGSTTALTQ